jgi:hypothetical protein
MDAFQSYYILLRAATFYILLEKIKVTYYSDPKFNKHTVGELLFTLFTECRPSVQNKRKHQVKIQWKREKRRDLLIKANMVVYLCIYY